MRAGYLSEVEKCGDSGSEVEKCEKAGSEKA